MNTRAAFLGGQSAAAAPAGVVGFPTALATAVGLIMASPVILTVTSGFGMGGSAFVAAIAFVVMGRGSSGRQQPASAAVSYNCHAQPLPRFSVWSQR